jgi:type II secretory pathway component GspD/PulD (secretin)
VIIFKLYNKFSFFMFFLIFLSVSATAQKSSFKILNSEIGEFVAYVSSLTGNTYILDFSSIKKISITRENLDTKEDIHLILVDTVDDLGGIVKKVSANTFEILHNSNEPVQKKVTQNEKKSRSIVRVDLEQKISFSGLKNLIKSDERFVSLKIIEENSSTDSVLLSGIKSSLSEFIKLLNTLESQAVQKRINNDMVLRPKVAKVDKKEVVQVKVFELNYADSKEIIESLKTLAPSVDDEISISAQESSNQIVLSGTLSSVKIFSEVIEKLDRAPRQVYLDAIIAEVSEESAIKLGLQFSVNTENISTSSVTGVSGTNIGAVAGDALLAGATGGILALGRGANLVPDIGIMLTALQGNSDNRILATPSLMASENKESIILVGQNVPFITGQFTNEGGNNSGPFQTIQREDLGTSLRLKPKIGANGNIIMEIWQETSRIDQSTPGLSDIVTVKRQISTVVSANDGETIAIGGLKVEQQEIGVSKVPFLGDLPFIGKAFRQEVTNSVSRNLVIFLRPTLVNDKKDRREIYKGWEKEVGGKLLNQSNNLSEYFTKKPIMTNTTTSLKPVMRPW